MMHYIRRKNYKFSSFHFIKLVFYHMKTFSGFQIINLIIFMIMRLGHIVIYSLNPLTGYSTPLGHQDSCLIYHIPSSCLCNIVFLYLFIWLFFNEVVFIVYNFYVLITIFLFVKCPFSRTL